MLNIKSVLFIMLFLTLSCRIAIMMMPGFGLPIISTFLVAWASLCRFYSAFSAFKTKEIVINIPFTTLFIIYTGFVLYQTFYSNIIPSDQCLGIDDLPAFIRSSFIILILSLLPYHLSKYLDFVKFAKWTVILILLFVIIYSIRIGFVWYTLAYGLSRAEAEQIMPAGFIGGLAMNGFVGLMMCCNLYLYDKWTKSKFWNYLIFISLLIIGLVLQAMLVERGPILFFAATFLIMFTAKGIFSPKFCVVISVVVFLFVIFSGDILLLLNNIFPAISDKFTDFSGSGRYGDDSITSISIDKILEHPFFGFHCRMTDDRWFGTYPHNIILELLMTVGVFISIPIFYYLYKALIHCYQLIKYDRPEALFAIIFLYRFLCLMTSGTIVANTQFWFSLAFVLSSLKYTKLYGNDIYSIK